LKNGAMFGKYILFIQKIFHKIKCIVIDLLILICSINLSIVLTTFELFISLLWL